MGLRQVQFLRARASRRKCFPYTEIAHDCDRDSDRAAARSHARSTPAASCAQAASTEAVRSSMRSKFPSRVRGVEQPIRTPSGARDRNPNSGRSGRRSRTPGIKMN